MHASRVVGEALAAAAAARSEAAALPLAGAVRSGLQGTRCARQPFAVAAAADLNYWLDAAQA
eukprot:1150852-Pelagomonas_calceolata.AAC.8